MLNKFAKAAFSAVAALALVATATPANAASAGVAQLPAKIKKAGVIVVGIDATYAPNDYKDAKGNAIGWDVDLFNAVAKQLGLKTKYVIANFDSILPAVKAGKYDVGVSSFTDTKERQANFDFADYYSAGSQWASQKGKKFDSKNICGLTIAVQSGTVQDEEIQAKSTACTKAGKKAVNLLPFDAQDQATSAVMLGRAIAMAADSPITQYAVKQSKGKLVLAGPIYDSAPYGYAVPKGSSLAKALSIALSEIKKSGEYDKILKKWGVEAGGISKFTVNGGTN